jgi:hypothetical protein
MLSDHQTARKLHEDSLNIARELGNDETIAQSLFDLAQVALDQADYTTAQSFSLESLMIRCERNDRPGIGRSLEQIGSLLVALGKVIDAALIFGAAARLRETHKMPLWPLSKARLHAAILRARLEVGDEPAFKRAWQEGSAMPVRQVIDRAFGQITIAEQAA